MKWLTILGLVCLTAVAAPAVATSERVNESIFIGTFGSPSGWKAVSRNEIVLWATPSRAYLITLRRNTPGLRFARHLGVSKTAGRITRFDNVIVDGQRLPISSIRAIDSATAKTLRYTKEPAGALIDRAD